jgi:RNA polymerase sigma factor (sigma-70 family)
MSPDTKEQLILDYLPYVEGITRFFCKTYRQRDVGEYQSITAERLMNCVADYDNTKRTTLKSWITRRVRHGLMDHFRKQTAWNKNTGRPLGRRELTNANCISDYTNSLILSVNGTELNLCNKDLVYKIFQYLDNKKKKRYNGRTDYSEILQMYFIEGYTMKEVGQIKNVTESRISQIISELKKDIRKHFKNIN